MSLLTSYTGNSNFWTINPQLKIPELFFNLYSEDSSEDKKESSDIMYALVFFTDPSEENKFCNIPIQDRKRLISKDFLKNPEFNWDKYTEHIELLKELVFTQAERSLINYRKELEQRDAFLQSTPWDLDTGEKKDKMMANTEKLYAVYDRICKTIQKEAIERKDKGGSKPTASDLGSM